MSLVAYDGSSDEQSEKEDEVSSSSMPSKKTREPVKIAIPSLREFKEVNDPEPIKKPKPQPEDGLDQSDIDVEFVKTIDNSAIHDKPETSTSSHGCGSTSCNSSRLSSRKRKLCPYDEQTVEVMTLVGKKIDSLNPDDTFAIFAKHVANKLRVLNSQQNIFAQKLINDVLFEAEMESLTRNFKVVDLGESQYHLGSTRNSNEWQRSITPPLQCIPQQMEKYPYISQQIGQQQFIPHQQEQQQNIQRLISQEKQMLQEMPNPPSETVRASKTYTIPSLEVYFSNIDNKP